jgi:hypothetical protein
MHITIPAAVPAQQSRHPSLKVWPRQTTQLITQRRAPSMVRHFFKPFRLKQPSIIQTRFWLAIGRHRHSC